MKQCVNCHKFKPVSAFYFYNKSKTKRYKICKTCKNKERTELRKRESPEKRRTRLNKDAQRHRIYIRADFKEYDNLYKQQHGCCNICGKHQSKMVKALALDHNHITGNIRGLLCHRCNTALGLFGADSGIILLEKATDYIKRTDT